MSEILIIFFQQTNPPIASKTPSTTKNKVNPLPLVRGSKNPLHPKTTLDGYVMALPIAAAKDGKAANGSLGVGAVKSLRTMLPPPKLDLLLLMSDSRILLTAAPALGSAGDQRAPSALAYMI